MKPCLLIVLSLMIFSTGCKKETAVETPTETPAAAPGDTPANGQVGCLATPLTGLEWVKNGPVKFTPGQFYIVEFWATWCGPCRTSIPHLTEVQAKYKDQKVTVIGISKESIDEVRPFVDEQGDKMNYCVAIDPDGAISKGYMTAFSQNGIPHAFLVDDAGKIVWHGHPMSDLEAVLDQVLAGSFDSAAYDQEKKRARNEAEAARKQAQEAFQRTIDELTTAIAADPKNPTLLVKRAGAWLENSFVTDLAYRPDRLPKALDDYQAALALDPQDPLNVTDDIAFLTAWTASEPERSDALKQFAGQFPDSPRRPFALYDSFYRAEKNGQLQEALDILEQMPKNCPPGPFLDYIEKSKIRIAQKLQAVQENPDQE